MKLTPLSKELQENTYPGRGIVTGLSGDGKYAVCAYFIMGRSANSRNRIFVEDGDGIRTQAFDPSKMEDPSLIIYAPVRVLGCRTIVTNGDQTDTVFEGLSAGKTFEQSLETRQFEPDGPNYTPRISALMEVNEGRYTYRMSVLKSDDGDPARNVRNSFFFDNPAAGVGHFIHTYARNEEPLPAFEGEPKKVDIAGGIDEFTEMVWNALNEDNKVSLFVRFIDLADGSFQTRIVNKNR